MDGEFRHSKFLKMNSKVEEYLSKKEKWRKELELLRTVFKELPVEETIKWGAPTYVYKGKNIVSLSAFKNYCGLWFFQGALLKDEQKVLYNAQDGKTKAMLQWRFNSVDEIDIDLIIQYVIEAIANSEAGIIVKPKKNTNPIVIPKELKDEFEKNEKLKFKFNELTKSKQREFCDHISSAKRETTKQSRLQKIIPMVLNGIGLFDKYKNC